METAKTVAQLVPKGKDAQQKSLQRYSQSTLQPSSKGEISVFTDTLTPQFALKQIAKLKMAFPALSKEFFDVLFERAKDLGFTNKRLEAAINRTIDTCEYPTFQMSRILSFDIRYKLYTYSELEHLIGDRKAKFDDFAKIRINGKVFWVTQSDKMQYNIPDEL